MALPKLCSLLILLALQACVAVPASRITGPDDSGLMSVRLKDTPLEELVSVIRERAGVRIVIDDEVKETVTLNFDNVDWREVLALASEVTGSVLIKKSQTSFTIERPYYYSGQSRPIQQVLDILSKVSGRKIVADPEVQGAIAVRLRGVEWRDALEATVRTLGYQTCECDDGTIRVTTRHSQHDDLVAESFRVRHHPPKKVETELLPALRRVLTPDLGTLEYFDKSNVIIVKDIKPVIDEIASILSQVDTKPQRIALTLICAQVGREPESLEISGWGGGATAGCVPIRLPFSFEWGLKDERALYERLRSLSDDPLISCQPSRTTEDQEPVLFRFQHWPSLRNTTKTVALEVNVTPRIVPGTDKIVIEVDPWPRKESSSFNNVCEVFQVPIAAAANGAIPIPTGLRTRHTALMQSSDTGNFRIADDTLLFVTARIVDKEPTTCDSAN